jgi:hypothetical protein
VVEGVSLGVCQESIDEFKSDVSIMVGLEHPIVFVGSVTTTKGQGGPGGRHDVFLLIHESDKRTASLKRLSLGIRWWEDVLDNGGRERYPNTFQDSYPGLW